MKKVLSFLLAFSMILSLCVFAHADDTTKLDALKTSAENSVVFTSVGAEKRLVIFPFPEEAKDSFDIQSVSITYSVDGIAEAKPYKATDQDQLIITGLKQGYTVVTVTDPSGVSCSCKVIVFSNLLTVLRQIYDRILSAFILFFTPIANH